MERVHKSEREWRKQLTPEQYQVLREHGTEPAYDNRYWDEHRRGTYLCAACGQRLFRSEAKYDSGTGWPSFWAPVDPRMVETQRDVSHGMDRAEVHCARCGGHLGHLFDDGPAPTGKRYCLNSAALEFKEDEKKEASP